jgi:uncharacterized protein (TIGR00369 family)
MTELPSAGFREMIPMIDTLGIEVVEARPDLVRASLAWTPELCTSGGVLHGGALMSLADTSGAICAYLNLPEGATGTATIESKTNFLRAVMRGVVTAVSRPIHLGRTLTVIDSELWDDTQQLVAKVTQTQIYHWPRS